MHFSLPALYLVKMSFEGDLIGVHLRHVGVPEISGTSLLEIRSNKNLQMFSYKYSPDTVID